MRVPKDKTPSEERHNKCIGQTSYRAFTLNEVLDIIKKTYADIDDRDGNICVITTVKSGEDFSQSVLFNRILED